MLRGLGVEKIWKTEVPAELQLYSSSSSHACDSVDDRSIRRYSDFRVSLGVSCHQHGQVGKQSKVPGPEKFAKNLKLDLQALTNYRTEIVCRRIESIE